MRLCFDVLIQFLCTLAVGEGFTADHAFEIVKKTYCFRDITTAEWDQCLFHITEGGTALQQYDEFKKVEVVNGVFKIRNRRMALRHRLHIGTIVSDSMLRVKFLSGGYVGVIEEYFISRLEPGDVFTLAGRNLELVQIKDMTVFVRKSSAKKSIVPSWMGGRMSLTANLGHMLRQTFSRASQIVNARSNKNEFPKELRALLPSVPVAAGTIPYSRRKRTAGEHLEDKDGFHLMVYPFEGRQVHEAMSAILAYRISQITPISFSIAMNDYGFELLSDQPIPVDDTNAADLFTSENLLTDIQRSTNLTEMATRNFAISLPSEALFSRECRVNKKKPGTCSLRLLCCSKFSGNMILQTYCYARHITKFLNSKWRKRGSGQPLIESRQAILLSNFLQPILH
jgi:ATP-dependent Lhr-like helicase